MRRKRRKVTKEILSTELRFLYNIKFGNETKNIWSTRSLFPLLADLQTLEWTSWLLFEEICQLLLSISREPTYYFEYNGETYSFAVTCKRSYEKHVFKTA